MKDYKAIFEKVESTLINVGSASLSADKIRASLDYFKHLEGKAFSDADYYWILVDVVFYAGFRAATVNDKLNLIHQYFPDYETVAGYDGGKPGEILSDPEMIRNKRKVQACIKNATAFKSIVSEHGSFQAYIDSFSPTASFENLMLLKEELEYRFTGLGRITTYHVITDIGLPVLKPDRVICRIFRRLGLIESDEQLLKTLIQGRKFAQATGHPIRCIDIVFVTYGQVKSQELGLDSGICLEQNPLCSICGVTDYCNYSEKNASHSKASCGQLAFSKSGRGTRIGMLETHGGDLKAKRFDRAIQDDYVKITNEDKREEKYPIGEIFDIMNWLTEKFGLGWFPLANDVAKLGRDTEVNGLGVAILRQQPGDISHAQGASYLGVVLEHVGILEWNGKQRGIQWRIIHPVLHPDELRRTIKAKMV
jgi:DNA-3-methyladenine glycosylase I